MSEQSSNILDMILVAVGALLFVAAAIIYFINSPEAWEHFDVPGLEHREATMRGIVFTAGPGMIAFCLGLGMWAIHRRTGGDAE